MTLLGRFILPPIFLSLCLLAVSTTAPAQATNGTPVSPEAAALQAKANDVEARIRGNEGDTGQLKRAVKLNEVALAKEILLRNGFTSKDLEDAKITLRTGGGKGGEDLITISVTCCASKEITIQRTLENFTKSNRSRK
jgi:hypothetical protein